MMLLLGPIIPMMLLLGPIIPMMLLYYLITKSLDFILNEWHT
jgi:hypothetical protein